MIDDLHALYQDVVLDHHKAPRNFRVLDGACTAEGHNPICGDRLTVFLRVRDGVIEDAAFQGSGCAIATASASLMTESVKGKSVPAADALFERFRRMITARDEESIDDLGILSALAGVRRFPVRIKCATLPWETLRAAIREK